MTSNSLHGSTPTTNVVVTAIITAFLVVQLSLVTIFAERCRRAYHRAVPRSEHHVPTNRVLLGKIHFMYLLIPYTVFSLLTWTLLLISYDSSMPTKTIGAFIFGSFFFYNCGFLAFFVTKGILCLAFFTAAAPSSSSTNALPLRNIVALVLLVSVVVVTVVLQSISLYYLKQSEFTLFPPIEIVEKYQYFQNVYFYACAAISSVAAIILAASAFRVYRAVYRVVDPEFSTQGNTFVRSLGYITVVCIASFISRGATALGFAYEVNYGTGAGRFRDENSAFLWFEPVTVVVSIMIPTAVIMGVLHRQVRLGLATKDGMSQNLSASFLRTPVSSHGSYVGSSSSSAGYSETP